MLNFSTHLLVKLQPLESIEATSIINYKIKVHLLFINMIAY